METLTLFIDGVYNAELGSSQYQVIQNRTLKSDSCTELTISGSLLKDVIFEEIIFENCTFFATTLDNCLFINCLFINCKFQFSVFSGCNFESTTCENCIWGLSALKGPEIIKVDGRNNYSFGFPYGLATQTRTLELNEFLSLSA